MIRWQGFQLFSCLILPAAKEPNEGTAQWLREPVAKGHSSNPAKDVGSWQTPPNLSCWVWIWKLLLCFLILFLPGLGLKSTCWTDKPYACRHTHTHKLTHPQTNRHALRDLDHTRWTKTGRLARKGDWTRENVFVPMAVWLRHWGSRSK